MVLAFAGGCVLFASVGWYWTCKRTENLRVRLRLALEVARKHEALLAAALPHVRNLMEIAQRAGMTEDALRIKTVENSIRFAIGMAGKIKED